MSLFGTIRDKITGTAARVLSNGGLAVSSLSKTTRALDLKFIRATDFTALTADTVIDSTVISVASTSGMAQGIVLGIVNPNGQFYFGEVISINVLDVTVDTALDQIFDFTTSSIIVANNHLNSIAGTLASPVKYQIAGVGVGTGLNVDITRIMGNMTSANIMYDELFGSLPILTNGCVLRVSNGAMVNQWNVKSNGALALLCHDANYPPKVPSGTYAFRFRYSLSGEEKHNVVIRLEPGYTLELWVQDDLTGLTDFQMMAEGLLSGD